MRRLLVPALVLAGACGPDEAAPDTWVTATVDGVAYDGSSQDSALLDAWSPNHLQMWPGDALTAVLFGWTVGEPQAWALEPIDGEGDSGLFWTAADGTQWISIDGAFEIDTFEEDTASAEDDFLGWAEGTFEGTLQDLFEGDTLEVTGGAFRARIAHDDGETG